MKLTFRGHSYKFPTPIEPCSDAANQSSLKLIYRGHTYHATPRLVVASEGVKLSGSTVTLIYRGNTYDRQLQSPKLYQKPRAINSHYQILGEG
ncbi:MAG: DUF4278 domain-containing protein [Oscillatoriophycideae cyanobacterium NC_groundwater_1537_Pr4_S-0.65um_50_18]|nr:DUF4278 domain-containing protein [Oscillatoriophycideae cyanobacterium NC_groundwater_1537_Pr4_S-0.65um_50_18]